MRWGFGLQVSPLKELKTKQFIMYLVGEIFRGLEAVIGAKIDPLRDVVYGVG